MCRQTHLPRPTLNNWRLATSAIDRAYRIIELPYVLWHTEDGRAILLNRLYRPLWQRTGDGPWEPVPGPRDLQHWCEPQAERYPILDTVPYYRGRLILEDWLGTERPASGERELIDHLHAVLADLGVPHEDVRPSWHEAWQEGAKTIWPERAEREPEPAEPEPPPRLTAGFNHFHEGQALLEWMNSQYTCLTQQGGRFRVMTWEPSELGDGLRTPALLKRQDFEDGQAHHLVEVWHQGKEGPEAKQVPLGKWWLGQKERAQYKAMRLHPETLDRDVDGYLNLWQGWSVRPWGGGWGRMRRHIWRVLANRDPASFRYIVRWAAWTIQNPDKQAEVALVFRGPKGSGKGMFGRALRRAFGQNGLHILSPKHLTGDFNAHLQGCCLLFADEAFYAGDKRAEAVLKGIVTEPELTVEGKGLDVRQVANRLHIVMASNSDWVVPASHDERRYAVFDVSGNRVGNRAYFKALAEETEGGGLAAMLLDLEDMELGDWHPRQGIPQTRALLEQKQRSLEPWQQVLLRMAEEGYTPDHDEWKPGAGWVSVPGILEAIGLREGDPRRRSLEMAVAKALDPLCVGNPVKVSRQCAVAVGRAPRLLLSTDNLAPGEWIDWGRRRMRELRPLAGVRALLSSLKQDWEAGPSAWSYRNEAMVEVSDADAAAYGAPIRH
jgi:hypothetical protein